MMNTDLENPNSAIATEQFPAIKYNIPLLKGQQNTAVW